LGFEKFEILVSMLLLGGLDRFCSWNLPSRVMLAYTGKLEPGLVSPRLLWRDHDVSSCDRVGEPHGGTRQSKKRDR
jgi:hypothetical protein